MRFFKVFCLTTALILTTGTLTYAADIDDMTIGELKEAYLQLEEENKTLRTQLDEALKNNAAAAAPDTNSEENPPADPDQPLFEQTDINCMIYGEGSERKYEMIVEVTNTSDVPLYLDAKSFDLEDASGHLLQTNDMISTAPDVILPGEKGYFYNPTGTSIDVDNPNDDLVFIPNYTLKKANKTPHDYPVNDISFKSDKFGYTMIGRVQNDTNETSLFEYASVIYYDKEGKCIGITGKAITDIEPGNTQSFEIHSSGIQQIFDPDKIDSYTLYIREMY